jgi:hypothetical protein
MRGARGPTIAIALGMSIAGSASAAVFDGVAFEDEFDWQGASFGIAGGRALPRFHRLMCRILRAPAEGVDSVVWWAASAAAKRSTSAIFIERVARRAHEVSFVPWERAADRQALWNLRESIATTEAGG